MLAGIWIIRGYGHWAIEVKETGELIGRAGAWFPDGWYPEMEAGWVVGREHWGSGYATEAGGEALRQVFATLGVDARVSLIDPDECRIATGGRETGREHRQNRGCFAVDEELLFYGYTSPPA